jgi:cytochrome c biogenesis protein CcmG, thiol:disulfide interchange protein DsbE
MISPARFENEARRLAGGPGDSGIMPGMTNPKIAALVLSSVVLCGSVASCRRYDPKTAVWGPVTCEVTAKNTPCGACSRASCCAEFQACALDAPCPCWLSERGGMSPMELSIKRCGPQNATYKALAACIDAHCPADCPADVAHHGLIGKPAPEVIAAPVLAEGLASEGPRSLAEARGKVVIVEFWATFCMPCKRSFPAYQEIVDRHRGEVAVLAVSGDDPEEVKVDRLIAFAKETRVRFPIFWDKTGEIQKSYRQQGSFPKTFVIDRAGVIRFVHSSFGPADRAQFQTEIEALLVERASKIPSGDASPSPERTP